MIRLLALLLLLASPALAAEEMLMLPGPDGTRLQTRLCRPDTPGPHRLLIMNHGAQFRAEIRSVLVPAPCDSEPVDWFTDRGYAVAVPLRRGHGASTGEWMESFGPCEDPDFLRVGRETARDIRAVLEELLHHPGIEPDHAVILGESAGGWGSIALAAERPSGVAAIINVAGGRGGWAGGRARQNCAAPRLIETMGLFGRTARVPMLWLYAINDSYFGPSLAGSMFEAFTAAGGVAEMTVLPQTAPDGHFMFFHDKGSETWGPRVELFLRSLAPPVTALR
ncbi:hypothetical protein EOD42_06690 [Rhodovarius crocodyli]|uniref:Xaa-Pro dipeptidyl-peptidase-like domain-containing protein n=1 Tax=Rhodovarius crocodyli TaxID=1979269 RepID=A0A437MIM1_9PROT|nr:CocE/NonD family hydrolase [Rhodovarius crocodyli]RVT97507.1 hypothetical protein EOD42_06690 [Rhodovarius crocodyli]